jgi:PhnB protein
MRAAWVVRTGIPATYVDIGAVEEDSQAEQIAFGRLDSPNGFSIMAYDVQPSKGYDPDENPFYLTLQGTAEEEIRSLWEALAESATAIPIPLGPAPFAPLYGMLTDRFGVTWIIGVEPEADGAE